MPARWAMREADFEVLLRLVERLGGGERGGPGGGPGGAPGGARGGGGGGGGGAAALGRALAAASGEPEAVRLIEGAFAAAPRCPHYGAERLQRWGPPAGCAATAARPAARPSTR